MTDPITRLNAALEGRYRIERELGEGGMATVYLADDLKHERKVALKVLKPELAAVVGAERFLAEIKTTANLQHPHILPLHDSGEADGFLYYVMPYIEGETLRDRLEREKQLPVDEAVRIASDVAEALHAAHEQGVIHRDIKPANILLSRGRPLVADFGIALAVSAAGGGRLTETGLSMGTPYYMSPEQASADREPSAGSDVYSLGCVLYEMLVGEPPYAGGSAQAVLAKILTEDARAPTKARPSIPANVDAAIRKALEKLPADRFSTAKDFATALSDPAFRHGEGGATVSEAGGLGRWKNAFAGMIGLAAGLAVWPIWSGLHPEPAPGILRYTLELPFEIGLVNDFGGNMDLSDDGTKLVFAGARDGAPRLWLRERDQLEPREIAGTEMGHQPFFSPDGTRVGFITEDRQLKVASLGGEPPLTLADSAMRRGGGAWGPDGYIYFSEGDFGADLAGLRRIPASGGGSPEVFTRVDTTRSEIRHYFPDVLPNGRGVLFVIHRVQQYNAGLAEIAIADIETGEHRVLFGGVSVRWSPSGHVLFVRADGAIMAAAFDDETLEVTGDPVPILDRVEVESLGTADLALSSNGTLMYSQASDDAGLPNRVVWVDRDGTTEEVDPGWTGLFSSPAISPDGSRLALTIVQAGEQQVWVKSLDRGPRGPLAKLTFEGAQNVRAAWTPGGDSVAFVGGPGGIPAFYVKSADGTGEAELVLQTEGAANEVLFSPDGEWLIYRQSEDVLGLRRGDDLDPTPLVRTVNFEGMPALSPDGRWLAYTSNESGQGEVYVRPFPDTDSGRWLVSSGGGTEPRWSHDGRELFFKSAQNLVSVEVIPGDTFLLGQQNVLFSVQPFFSRPGHAQYDVSADDQRFLMILDTGRATGGRLIVVENFFEELKRLAPN